jgi:cell division transport system permease protein
MRISTLWRHLRESLRSLGRNGWMTFASISGVAITLLILGLSLVIALNAQQMSNYVAGQLEVDVYLKQSVSDAQGQELADQVRTMPGVKSVEFVSKEQGFKDLQNRLGAEYKTVLSGLSEQNTLPVRLVVKAEDPRQTLTIANQLRQLPDVDQVHDGKAVVDKVFRFLDVVRNIGLVFVGALVLTTMFLISNTIKITIFSRRREIEIMKLVGATNWFIRWPFLLEGAWIGVIGALLPYVAIVGLYQMVYERVGGTFAEITFPLIPVSVLAERLALVMFGLGVLIGVWGGVMSIRRFLRV